ncbi:hypothetical protein [Microvirga sp. CF3016]|uniref:hypothetical protein n=1 Tax=Microvirga sp. CF3016 TaxID=3110181 RepID=UPI002E771474|nr:hypothetical protein [Microvirga sp. CF3016]MEE1611858.1 hypothetical protein [Microvirga sp. CF3016]
MQHINLSFFVDLGASLNAFGALGKQQQSSLADAYSPLADLDTRLEKLLNGDPIRLETAAHSARELFTPLRALLRRHYYVSDTDQLDWGKDWNTNFIADWEFLTLKRKVEAFQHVMAAEFQNSATFYVPQRMGYHTPTLILNATVCAGLWDEPRFQGVARHDFNEAGKCLAFGMPTAAGFHAARSVEAILILYYEAFCGPRPERLMMGDAIRALEAKVDPEGPLSPSRKVLRTLREIKDLDRNPLAHPDATLDMIEAKALFDLAGIAIVSMLRGMYNLERAKAGSASDTAA